MALRNGMRSIVIIYITYNNNIENNNNNNLLEFELSLGSSPYTSTEKTNKNKYVMLITEEKCYILAVYYVKL